MTTLKKHILLLVIFSNSFIIASQEKLDPVLVIVPGQNGLGGQNLEQVLPQYKNTTVAETPLAFPDFGQSRCFSMLKSALANRKYGRLIASHGQESEIVLHASSQGTATALNYFSFMQDADYKDKKPAAETWAFHDRNQIKALIL